MRTLLKGYPHNHLQAHNNIYRKVAYSKHKKQTLEM